MCRVAGFTTVEAFNLSVGLMAGKVGPHAGQGVDADGVTVCELLCASSTDGGESVTG
jgi:hypothetical protein